MDKKKILFVNYNMFIGGSTTSLLSMLNCLDKSRYDVDLLLYKKEGPLLPLVPEGVQVLREAALHNGKGGRVVKIAKFIFKGYLFKAMYENRKAGKRSFSEQVLSDFQAIELARKLENTYDFAVGFLEGWADRYVAYHVKAAKKYGWLHAEFNQIALIPHLESSWMQEMDKIVTVAEKCRVDFCASVPEMASKAVFYENVMDTELVRLRAQMDDAGDEKYATFLKSELFKIITVCRLDMDTKGLDRAVLCAARLKAAGMKFLWYVVGEGEDRNKLEAMIAASGVADCFFLIGNRINPYPYVRISDIFCMPSRWEGKPIAVTESMMLGVPPIVTEYLSAREQITDGVDGLVAENRDDAIFEKVRYCMEHTSAVGKMKKYLLEHEYGNRMHIDKIQKELFDK
jgi:glycosyltransferase involved in cell wall biosynthesis